MLAILLQGRIHQGRPSRQEHWRNPFHRHRHFRVPFLQQPRHVLRYVGFLEQLQSTFRARCRSVETYLRLVSCSTWFRQWQTHHHRLQFPE